MARSRFQDGAETSHYHDRLGVEGDITGEQTVRLITYTVVDEDVVDGVIVFPDHVPAGATVWGGLSVTGRSSDVTSVHCHLAVGTVADWNDTSADLVSADAGSEGTDTSSGPDFFSIQGTNATYYCANECAVGVWLGDDGSLGDGELTVFVFIAEPA